MSKVLAAAAPLPLDLLALDASYVALPHYKHIVDDPLWCLQRVEPDP